MAENNDYILGTDQQELHRLGVQHQIWASEAQRGWELAGFSAGQTFLDLGCGPGFCSKELAYIAGASGKVIGIDKSPPYIDHLKDLTALHHLNIESFCTDFDTMELQDNSLDGMYCRWALAWVPNPKEVLSKVYKALKPGGRMVIHEYYDWSTHQSEPYMEGLGKGIAAAYKSFGDSEGDLNIGRHLPRVFDELGMKVTGTRIMSKLATPKELVWQWPKSFYVSFFPRLVEAGYLTDDDVNAALDDLAILEKTPGSTLCCPMMIEVIAQK
jgi:SAM-dependent methyltransferase